MFAQPGADVVPPRPPSPTLGCARAGGTPSPWGCLPGPQGTGGGTHARGWRKGASTGPPLLLRRRPLALKALGVNRPRVPEWVPPAAWLPALGVIACGCGSGECLRVPEWVPPAAWLPVLGVIACGCGSGECLRGRAGCRFVRAIACGWRAGCRCVPASARGWRTGCRPRRACGRGWRDRVPTRSFGLAGVGGAGPLRGPRDEAHFVRGFRMYGARQGRRTRSRG